MQPSLFHGACSTHEQYLLTCEGMERLRSDHRDSCRLCGRSLKHMNIDHDHMRGWSAIRGLLCARCNAAHMRRVDHGDWAVDEITRDYLLTPWHLGTSGEQLAYEPRARVSIAELPPADRAELDRLSLRMRTPYSIACERPRFEHPAVASCLENADLRPVLRLLLFLAVGEHERDIAV